MEKQLKSGHRGGPRIPVLEKGVDSFGHTAAALEREKFYNRIAKEELARVRARMADHFFSISE